MAPTPDSNATAEPTPPEIVSKFKEILKANGIDDPVSEVIVKDSGLKGENMASQTQYVTVNFENPKKKPLNLFTKRPTVSAAWNQMLDEWQLFKKETMFFMEYLPVAREYCKRVGAEGLMNIYPKCYYGDEKLIIFENLVLDKGYVLLNKEEQQDFETARHSLKNLAKHHALSYALIKDHGGPTAFFNRFPKLKFEAFEVPSAKTMMGPSIDNGVDTNIKILEKCGLEGSAEAIEKFKSLKGKHFDQMLATLKTAPNDFLVLNHGDYWNNNMMFLKDKETNKIFSHIAVDFQVLRYSSPCVDLGYYIFTSVKPTVRRLQMRSLLEVYLDALKIAANELGHPIDLSFEELQADFCSHFHLGFWMGIVLTTGAGYAVLKDIDLSQMTDASKWAQQFDELITQWIAKNPEKCQENSKNILEYIKDYERFTNGIIT